MAHKTLVCYALCLVYFVYASETDVCPCENTDLVEDPELWKFLKSLSKDVPPNASDMYAVLPGELSPLIDCECSEFNRQKKASEKEADKEVQTPPEIDEFDDQRVRSKKSLRNPGTCPMGMVKLGVLCVPESLDMDYDK